MLWMLRGMLKEESAEQETFCYGKVITQCHYILYIFSLLNMEVNGVLTI